MNEYGIGLEVFGADGAFSLYRTGLDVIRAVQSAASPALTAVMKGITGIVSEYVFFAVILVLFWTVRERKAFRLGMLIICGLWLNLLMKRLFAMPRPFHLDPALGMIPERGGGFPSGHAQLAVLALVPPAVWYARRYRIRGGGPLPPAAVWTAAALLILAVSFSRVYLGVHFPQDIVGGWLFAALCLAVFFAVERRPVPRPFKLRLAFVAAASLVMNALYPQDSVPGALLLGFAAGYAVLREKIAFTTAGVPPRTAALRLLAGFTGAFALYLALKALFPGSSSAWYAFFRFTRYAVVGLWVTAGAPFLFSRLLPASPPAASPRNST